MRAILSVLRNRNMGLLLSGSAISTAGDWLYSVALSVAIYQFSHHKAYYIGLFWVIRLVPSLTFGPVAGVVAARLGYRRTMLLADLGRMVLVTVLAFLMRPETWAAIYPVAFGVVALGSLAGPSSMGLIPALVPAAEQRMSANSAMMQISSLAAVLGSAVGGAAIALGYQALLLLDAGSFLVSALALALIRARSPESAETEAEEHEEVGTGILAGVRLLRGRPLILFAAVVMVLPEFASGAGVVWFIPMAEKVLNLGGSGVGYLYSALGLGALIGSIVAAFLGTSVRLNVLLVASVVLVGLSFALFGAVSFAPAALFFALLVGVFEAIEYTAYDTLVQQAVPERLIAHVFGTLDAGLTTCMLLGNLVSGFLLLWFGVQPAIVLLGIAIVVAAGLGWFYLQVQSAGKPSASALAKIPAFSEIPSDILEWAVRRMTREEFPAGAVVVERGTEGDRFYTIAGGRAVVEVPSGGERELQKGDFFGEIALLHSVPRTATVRAATRLVVWTLSREDFDQLYEQAPEFRHSLLDIATARLATDTNLKMTLAMRGT